MATVTLGTNAATSLTALAFNRSAAVADVASIAAGIKNDLNVAHPRFPGFTKGGLLFVPNRGVLQVLPGDYVGFDATTGWPILLSAFAIASGPWTHS
jgi:hypothetical protein